jgi:hypothetical protein
MVKILSAVSFRGCFDFFNYMRENQVGEWKKTKIKGHTF